MLVSRRRLGAEECDACTWDRRLRVGGQILTVIESRGTVEESGLIYIDENGQGRNPF